jgi:type I restriction enzyme S subunit
MELLERHFDIALETPDGIKKLRELILTLAMQGKLVMQDPKEQPASELLKEIDAEKRKLPKNIKFKRTDVKSIKIKAGCPYNIPENWQWMTIDKICYDWGQKKPDEKFIYIDVGSIDNSKGVISAEVQQLEPQEAPSRARKMVKKGTIIYSTVRPYLLNIAIIGKEYEYETIASTAFAIIHTFSSVLNTFVYHYLHSRNFIDYVEKQMKGVAYPAISDACFFNGLIPLPPFDEQKRIVAKIDQLMALCDKLEKERNERKQKRLTIHTAAMNNMLSSTEKESFNKAWSFITKHFNELYSVPENVADLKKAILQLAVMGKLVPQDPKDQPASELLKEIDAEKKRLIKEGMIKKQEPLPPIKPEEIPYEVPKGWEWCRLIELVDVGTGSTPATTNSAYYNGTIPWYTSSSTNKWIADEPEKYITEKAIKETNCKIFPSGSLIIALYGQGKTRGQISELLVAGATNQAIAAMIFYEKSNEIKTYIKYFFCKIYDEIRLLAEGAAQPNLNVGKIKNTLVPLPPLREQIRIVAKIDQLMKLCDSLDEHIKDSTEKKTAILNAVMAGV